MSETNECPEVLPCPFCGSKSYKNGGPVFSSPTVVQCGQCGARMPGEQKPYQCKTWRDDGDAVTRWNRRAKP